MMTYIHPKACIEVIKCMQSFGGDTMEKRKFHAINWDMITSHKYVGGLGLRKSDEMNKVCFMKLMWKLHNVGEDLWCKVLKNTYRVISFKECVSRGCDSKFWRDIVRFMKQVHGHGS